MSGYVCRGAAACLLAVIVCGALADSVSWSWDGTVDPDPGFTMSQPDSSSYYDADYHVLRVGYGTRDGVPVGEYTTLFCKELPFALTDFQCTVEFTVHDLGYNVSVGLGDNAVPLLPGLDSATLSGRFYYGPAGHRTYLEAVNHGSYLTGDDFLSTADPVEGGVYRLSHSRAGHTCTGVLEAQVGGSWILVGTQEKTLPTLSAPFCHLRFDQIAYGEYGQLWVSKITVVGTTQYYWGLQSLTGPSPRFGHQMAFNSDTGETFLQGGTAGTDTWKWDGVTWQHVTDTGPSWRYHHAMVYDAARGELVLFGGWPFSNDTWVYGLNGWTEKSPDNVPPARCGHGMVYDSARGVLVMFGGSNSSEYFADTWEWDGTNWTDRTPQLPDSPPARDYHGMTYDAARGETVLFGGWGPGELADTWVYNGNDWTQRNPDQSPPMRLHHRMTYDAARAVTVLFGGMYSQYADHCYGDAWEWDGATWTQLADPGIGARYAVGMSYDAWRQKTVLFGGYCDPQIFGDTWEYPESRGDLNCDGAVNAFDIDPFVLALTNAAGYQLTYPCCDILNADCNADGAVNAFDIDPFVALLSGG
jgi:hypothetical protein